MLYLQYMKNLFFILLSLFVCTHLLYAQKSIQERLGYPKNTKLLIIHGDDLGVSHAENEATTTAMVKGAVSSASIMVPCPWFSEIASYAASHPGADLGLHLTLTSEWKYYKWGSVSGNCEVPGLLNKQGYLYSTVDSVYKQAKLKEIEKELRAQIEKARLAGIDFTHFDSHMGTSFGNTEYLKLYIRLGKEYKVPVLLLRSGPRSAFGVNLDSLISEKDVMADKIYIADPVDFKNGMENYYTKVLNSIQPGLNVLIIHTAYDDKEMQAITMDHPEYGAAWRQADYNFFTSDHCKKILKDQDIHVITWREIRDKLTR
ncbi:MAG: polysaccharide deacetylase family protein [Bacteroidota bacterium]|nr:polysaccharide deacetylase family protein [Bacteroidota bacterium]